MVLWSQRQGGVASAHIDVLSMLEGGGGLGGGWRGDGTHERTLHVAKLLDKLLQVWLLGSYKLAWKGEGNAVERSPEETPDSSLGLVRSPRST